MGTRSYIGIENGDGTISGVYCHWDGYPEGVGAILRDFYGQPERVRLLVAGGNLSSLGPDIEPAEGVAHSFQMPADGVCVYYGRDRGDTGEGGVWADSADAFTVRAAAAGAEYAYILRGVNRWHYATVAERGGRVFAGPWRRLTEDAVTAVD